MGRTVTALVTHGGVVAGVVGPFAVANPWWAQVEPVVAQLEETLEVPVLVLRLLTVQGSDGGRDGHVTYHVQALRPPLTLLAGDRDARPGATGDLTDDEHPLRMPWARESGIRELFDWAGRHVELSGPPVQHKTWNLAGLFRAPTSEGPVWIKAIPAFAAAEPAAIAALGEVDPGFVPSVLASAPGRLLLTDVPGQDCWGASAQTVADVVRRLVRAQTRIEHPPDAIRDRRPPSLAIAVAALLEGPVGADLSPEELRSAQDLRWRWEKLNDCGLPDTLVHGDFHPGNWRRGAGPPVVLDLADAHLGNPVLDGLRAIDFLPADRQPVAARAWIAAWQAAVPRSRPAEALQIAAPLAHLAYAVRYQEFLDNIEPSERVYHVGDPAAAIRHALRTAQVSG